MAPVFSPLRSGRWFIVAGAVALLSGCAAVPVVHVGQFDLDESKWEKDRVDVSARASFELRCANDRLTLTALNKCQGSIYSIACQIGVDGCGHRLVYQRTPSGWALNSSDGSSAP